MKKRERFVNILSEGKINPNQIWVDTETGVNYLFVIGGDAGGLTPLINAEGKPIISNEYVKQI